MYIYPASPRKRVLTQGRFNIGSAIQIRMQMGEGGIFLPSPRYRCHVYIDTKPTLPTSFTAVKKVLTQGWNLWDWATLPS